jgi:2-keto-4-pentenoate hydratase/2-oxohepta-3-ene-1,7-dioic acid hydratase in catechol pathway
MVSNVPLCAAMIEELAHLTGTPSGVGLGRTPHRWLRPGETITEIERIGQLINPVIAEA